MLDQGAKLRVFPERDFWFITARNGGVEHVLSSRLERRFNFNLVGHRSRPLTRLASTTPPSERNVRDRGVLAWSFEAVPGEAKGMPTEKVIGYEQAKRELRRILFFGGKDLRSGTHHHANRQQQRFAPPKACASWSECY